MSIILHYEKYLHITINVIYILFFIFSLTACADLQLNGLINNINTV